MSVAELTIYTTPTCGTCKSQIRRFEREGTPITVVDLTEHPDVLADLKERLGTERVQAPMFDWKGQLGTLVDLRSFEAELKQDLALAN